MTTRAEFIGRVRREAARTAGLFPARVSSRPADPAAAAEAVARQLALRWPSALQRFREEFEGVAGVLHVVPGWEAVPAVIAGIARERGATRVMAWSAAALGVDPAPPLRAHGLEVVVEPHDLAGSEEAARLRAASARAEIGLTGVDLAIAETGTIVLRSGIGRPRSASLLPEYHVAVFDRRALVETLEQAGVILEAWHAEGRSTGGSAINFITGPSRTADIELTLTRGVHGPREVHAIFLAPGA
jgi:L-lactate dehydrogenase complex protein LldG